MWSRVIEVLLGICLLMSPFVFDHPQNESAWWINDFLTGGLVVLLAMLSFWNRTRRVHVLILPVCCWLVGFAYWHGFGEDAADSHNHLISALTLRMFAEIPNHASQPPRAWRKIHEPQPET